MNKIIYKQKNKIALALLAISVVISGRVSSASSSTSNEPVTQEQGGTGASSSSSDPVVPPTVGSHRDNAINITMRDLNGNEFSLSLPAHATTYDLYRAAESQVNGGIGITSGGERIPNYLYPTNTIRLTDLGITNNTRLGYVRMEHNSYQLHPDDTTLDEASITRAIERMFNPMVMRRRLAQLLNTHEPVIHYPNSVEYSSDGENWCRLDKDAHIFMKLRCVEDRSNPRQTSYVVATPAFVCDGDGPQYVEHLYMNKRSLIQSGHKLNTEDLHPFAELKPLIPASFGYEYYTDAIRDDHSGRLAPSHIYKVNTNDLNHLWNILSAYYIPNQYTIAVVELSQDHNPILRTLLQNIGITYDLEFHNLLLEESGGGGEFLCTNILNPEEAQWLRLAFRDRMEPYSAAGRIYVRNNVGGQPACFVTLNPLPVLINA